MPVYSYSRLETYQNCPLKYKFQYIDRIPRRTSGVEAFVGSRVHEALEKLYKDLLAGKRNTKEDLLTFYDQQWARHWDEETVTIVRTDIAPDDYHRGGLRCVDMYYDRHQPFDEDATMGVEVRVVFALDPESRYRMQGYIDRLVRAKDGVWEIQDYKTSSSLPTQEQVDEKSQLALYQIGVQQKWPQVKKFRQVWHFLRHDTALSSTRTEDQLDDLRRSTIQLIEEIEAQQDFPPTKSNLCSWCDFQDRCPMWKHLVGTTRLPPEKFNLDDGVRLVDELASLQDQARENKVRTQEIKAKLAAYARQEKVEVIAGSEHLATVRFGEKLKFPESGDDKREELEALLRQAGKWEEISSLSSVTLNKALSKEEWSPDLVEKVKAYATTEEDAQVRLKNKKEEG
ncbi:RecB family exonuclease [Candidatus Zixiibacteriota bacterium]